MELPSKTPVCTLRPDTRVGMVMCVKLWQVRTQWTLVNCHTVPSVGASVAFWVRARTRVRVRVSPGTNCCLETFTDPRPIPIYLAQC